MFEDRLNDGLNFIDLFAGGGGLSEGFIQAGYNPIAHVEMMPHAAETLRTRAAYHYLKHRGAAMHWYYEYERGDITREELWNHVPSIVKDSVINREMSEGNLPEIFCQIDDLMKEYGIHNVDLVIGGPPCQAYSLAGRGRKDMSDDPRNELYKLYAEFLNYYKPKMFVFENVAGITSAKGGDVFEALKRKLDEVGYSFEAKEQNARKFGVLQNRRRMIIIGWRKDAEGFYPNFPEEESDAIVNDLLSDLPPLHPGEKANINYRCDLCDASEYLRKSGLRTENDVLTGHEARNNKQSDIEIYGIALKQWYDGHKRLHYDELPERLQSHKNRTSFKDRFKVVEGDEHASHTILAHLSKDGHYFIHPDVNQCRSITVREAARIQSFPDSYFFEGNRTSQFVQIGNAVPPMMAKGIAMELKVQLIK